ATEMVQVVLPNDANPLGFMLGGTVMHLIDIAGATLVLIVIAPLLFATAIAIKLTSRGPVLFRQTRIGYRGRAFTIYKFRSMYADMCDEPGDIQAIAGDERVTPLGRFMRRTSIDELPQLFNVLIGNMSLVGPRPYVPGMLAAGRIYRLVVPYFDMRHSIKPGVTGWAQANGHRGPTDSVDMAIARVDHDIAYVQNFSIWLDLRIILATAWREVTGGSGV
ncbi:MAG: sugar transferase, partial [Devosia sp.]